MNIIITLVLTILSIQSQFEGSKVKILHQSNFTDITSIKLYKQQHEAQNNWLIMFYAPWCPHCQRLAPTFIQLAKKRNFIGALDWYYLLISTQSQSLCSGYTIRGYPTILYFVKGKGVYQYNYARTLEYFQKFIDQNLYLNSTLHQITQPSIFTFLLDEFQNNWVSILNKITFLITFLSSFVLVVGIMIYCICIKNQQPIVKKQEMTKEQSKKQTTENEKQQKENLQLKKEK